MAARTKKEELASLQESFGFGEGKVEPAVLSKNIPNDVRWIRQNVVISVKDLMIILGKLGDKMWSGDVKGVRDICLGLYANIVERGWPANRDLVCKFSEILRFAAINGFVNVIYALRRLGFTLGKNLYAYSRAIQAGASSNQREVVEYFLTIGMPRNGPLLLAACRCGVDVDEESDKKRAGLIEMIFADGTIFFPDAVLFGRSLEESVNAELVHVVEYLIKNILKHARFVHGEESDIMLQSIFERACGNNNVKIVRIFLAEIRKLEVKKCLEKATCAMGVDLFDELIVYVKRLDVIDKSFMMVHVNGPWNFMRCVSLQNRGVVLGEIKGFGIDDFRERLVGLKLRLAVIVPAVLAQIMIEYC
ncbi:MAG: hypothetical protein Harvfovirus6_50 [Harvfovirus sp.]|uniref:Uncharacterized protein n=1 Tax=Harvfovirus sp. TaxID=2487768 RepID=A0A3G5A0Y5_9VIRU|nr:MAG: hypothetical protein Harvfovirus6_50 [Harvfovirus sp.]